MVLRIISIVSLGCGSGAGNGNSGMLATGEEMKDGFYGSCRRMSINVWSDISQEAVWVSFKELY